MAKGARMHSARHYRQRAAQVRRLTESVLDPVLLEQLKIVASDYDQIADDMDKLPEPTSQSSGFAARAVSVVTQFEISVRAK
jgi:hypothetical protein